MAGSLVFDPASEDATNVPFELMGPSDDPLVGVTAFSFPAPPLDVQWAGSVDTEGTLPASRKYQNRQINVSLRILDQGLPAATNLVTNPSGEIDLTGIANSGVGLNAGSTVTREAVSPYVGSARVKVVTPASVSRGVQYLLGATMLNGLPYQIAIYVMGGTGGESLDFQAMNAAGTVTSTIQTFTATASWARYTLTWTPGADATTPVLVVRNATATAVTFYVDAVQVVQASAVTPYFDGDTPGCSWTGTRHASTSTRPAGAARAVAALGQLQAKVAKIAREGGTLQWTRPQGDVRIYDLHAADTFEPTFDIIYNARRGAYCAVQIGLMGKPYARGVEVDLGDNVTTTLPWLVFTDTPIAGDVEALGRLVVDNDEAATAMRHLVWGVQERYYSAVSTAALYYEAEACALLAGSLAVGPAGASGGGSNVVQHTNLSSTRVALHYLGASATGQTHVGTFKVFARCYAPNTNAGTVAVGVEWFPYPQGLANVNPTVDLATSAGTPIEQQWVVAELGQVTIPKTLKGTQGWIGYLTAASTVVGDDINVDWIALIPVDEGYGEAYALTGSSSPLVPAAGLSVEARHNGVIAQSVGGTYWVKPDVFEGDYVLIPPSGAEGRTLRVACRFSTHIPLNADRDLVSVAADVVGDVSARLFVTPRYLT